MLSMGCDEQAEEAKKKSSKTKANADGERNPDSPQTLDKRETVLQRKEEGGNRAEGCGLLSGHRLSEAQSQARKHPGFP
jgi:hypothetical protein